MERKLRHPIVVYTAASNQSTSYPKDYSFGGETNSHLKPKPIVLHLQCNSRLQIDSASVWIADEESS